MCGPLPPGAYGLRKETGVWPSTRESTRAILEKAECMARDWPSQEVVTQDLLGRWYSSESKGWVRVKQAEKEEKSSQGGKEFPRRKSFSAPLSRLLCRLNRIGALSCWGFMTSPAMLFPSSTQAWPLCNLSMELSLTVLSCLHSYVWWFLPRSLAWFPGLILPLSYKLMCPTIDFKCVV